MDAQKKYYRIVGMPLAMQVWFYECCSDVDPKISLRVDDVVPRILNWRTTENQPNFAYLMNDMFNDNGNMIVYKDIHPSDIELAITQIPPVGTDVENRPTPAHSDKSGEDSDDFSPTPDLQCKKKHVESVGPSSSPPYKKRKEHERHHNETEYQSKIPPVCVSEFGQNVLHDNQLSYSKNDEVSSLRKDLNSFKEYKPVLNAQCVESRGEGNTTSEVTCNIPSIGQEGVSIEFYVSQFKLDDKFLPNQIPETRIVIHNSAKKAESTPHIDVIFYYLRKKGKYNQTSNFKYTTVDCIFKTRIAEIFDRYADTDSNANVANEEDVVYEYIRGYRLLANVPWHTVDNILIPVNLRDKLHWVLAVVSFKERCIKVYDSYRSACHDKAESIDCGVHVAAYTEFLSTIGEIPQTTFDSNLLRQRYGTLFWDYAMRKIDADAISENEAPSKIARQITESDSKMQIVLE
uniref:Uncharacterized protein LOC104227007 n=1 Tax=Nicotiana sylvestris TaxID=4096 RepID=A0A1U7WBS3_NICSY|nr:PREDICTED: uncharacterized protein LOC104227007 [Nicotiana sylvestris]